MVEHDKCGRTKLFYSLEHYNIPYGYLPPPEYTTWDWFSLVGFMSPFVILMLPAGIASIGYLLLLVVSGFYNFYVDLFLLFFFFVTQYALSLFLFLNIWNYKIFKKRIYNVFEWTYFILIMVGVLGFHSLFTFLFFEVNYPMNDILFLFFAIVALLVASGIGCLTIYIKNKYSITLFSKLYGRVQKYGERIGLIKFRYGFHNGYYWELGCDFLKHRY